MCGIFGVSGQLGKKKDLENLRSDVNQLFSLSQDRGQDASGFAMRLGSKIDVLNQALKPNEFIKHYLYKDYWKNMSFGDEKPESFTLLGHTRLETSGSSTQWQNLQPMQVGDLVGVHNGILAGRDFQIGSGSEDRNDSAYFFKLINDSGDSLVNSAQSTLEKISGSSSFALLDKSKSSLVFGTNNGSLFYFVDPETKTLFFASEKNVLQKLLTSSKFLNRQGASSDILQVGIGQVFSWDQVKGGFTEEAETLAHKKVHFVSQHRSELKRCTRCILPHTYPFISFDDEGVCNYCRQYEKQKVHGYEALEKALEPYRSKDGSPDCLVGLSGGRDSCYGLHVLKKEFGMNPVAYTYDWGLTTEKSRRNQSLMCGKLGVEHVVRSPDIVKKRRHIRKNILAWSKRPHLGMIPLFQAGDKDFYHYGRQLRKEMGIDLTVLCSGYQLEQREFMVGFMGVDQPPIRNNADFYYYPVATKAHLAARYALEYVKNPAYINESFFDSIRAYFMSFVMKANFLYLFKYIPWEEKKIEKTLQDEYDWERDKEYGKNQWRMGDGQTAFNNYIYHLVAGFTEFDTFRANQIREGMITRDEALELIRQDNEPKTEVMRDFFFTVGVPYEEVMRKVNSLEPLY